MTELFKQKSCTQIRDKDDFNYFLLNQSVEFRGIIKVIHFNRASPFNRNLPIGVIRESFPGSKLPFSADSKTHIDRNLYITNNFPFSPTRSCLKMTAPLSCNLIRRLIRIKNGDKRTNPIANTKKSKLLLIRQFNLTIPMNRYLFH